MTTNVRLTPDLERFARECVDNGRYADVSEVVSSALGLLQEVESRRREFNLMLHDAEAEADRDGTFSVESVLAEIDEIIAAAR